MNSCQTFLQFIIHLIFYIKFPLNFILKKRNDILIGKLFLLLMVCHVTRWYYRKWNYYASSAFYSVYYNSIETQFSVIKNYLNVFPLCFMSFWMMWWWNGWAGTWWSVFWIFVSRFDSFRTGFYWKVLFSTLFFQTFIRFLMQNFICSRFFPPLGEPKQHKIAHTSISTVLHPAYIKIFLSGKKILCGGKRKNLSMF